MKRNCTAKSAQAGYLSAGVCKAVLMMAVLPLIVLSCSPKKEPAAVKTHGHHADTVPGLQTKPVNAAVLAAVPVIKADTGMQILTATLQGRVVYDSRSQIALSSRIAGRVERLYIRYNYQPVKKGQPVMEIYSPDLVAAQRELLLLAQSGREDIMLQRAKERLLLLGMSSNQISRVLQTGKPFYKLMVYSAADGYIVENNTGAVKASGLPVKASAEPGAMDGMGGGNSGAGVADVPPVAQTPLLLQEGQYVGAGQTMFTVYDNKSVVAEFASPPSLTSFVAKNAKIVFHRAAAQEATFTGTVGLVQPVWQVGAFTRVNVYLPSGSLRVGELLTGYLPVVADKGWWLPAAAVWQTGNKSYVFRRQGPVFVPVSVVTGIKMDNKVQVLQSLNGWELAADAAYLVDSESFLQSSIN